MSFISRIMDKPLRPVFITPESEADLRLPDDYYPVILLTASSLAPVKRIPDRRFVYIQGAADDQEAWSHGLTSTQFWDNHEAILKCTQEDELLDVIHDIVNNYKPMQMIAEVSPIACTGLSVGIGNTVSGTTRIVCGTLEPGDCDHQTLFLNLPIKSRPYVELTQITFPAAVLFAFEHGILSHSLMSVVAIDTSRDALDLSIAVSLVLLCLFFDDEGACPAV
jgi:tRNA A64-2'-O-ribosylphosphate transferase